MKPLIIVQFDPDVDFDNVKKFDEFLRKEIQQDGILNGYDAIVFQGTGKISVHYPFRPISYYFNKLKAWVFLKIWKRKQSSNTSVII